MKMIIFLLIHSVANAQLPIYECNQSVFYRTQIRISELYPDRSDNNLSLIETRIDQQNLQINIYQNEKMEVVTKYEVPSCKIRSIDINMQN